MSSSYIPFTDLKQKIHSYTNAQWQEEWNRKENNKLFEIRPNLSEKLPSPGGSRKDNVVFTHLKIGNTFLTHSHLLKQGKAPQCALCRESLTVKHLLLTCKEYTEKRNKHYTAETIRELFRDVPPWLMLEFMKETELYKYILSQEN